MNDDPWLEEYGVALSNKEAQKKFLDEGFPVEEDYPYWGLVHYTNIIRFTDKNALEGFLKWIRQDYPDIWWNGERNTTKLNKRGSEILLVRARFSADQPDDDFHALNLEQSKQFYIDKYGHPWVDPDQ